MESQKISFELQLNYKDEMKKSQNIFLLFSCFYIYMIEELIKKIALEANISEEEVQHLIDDKKTELSDLISDEGAAYIVAKELGIPLIKRDHRLNIENVVPGMRNVEVVGRIIEISSPRSFKTEKAEGSVMSIHIADETGSIRISLWNEEIEKASNLKEGDVIKVKGYVHDNMGLPEMRLGLYGEIEKVDEVIPEINLTIERTIERVNIGDLKEHQHAEIRAAIVQIFETNPFYETCHCGKRLRYDGEKFSCPEHGVVEPIFNMIISGVADDGTGNIRVVFFRNNAEELLGLKTEEAKNIYDKKDFSALLKNFKIGKEFILIGRVKKNSFFDRLEFIVNNVKKVDVKKEIEKLVKEVEKWN